MVTKKEIRILESNVLRGVKLLDKTDADWWKRKNGSFFPGSIDLATLDLAESYACVLGQLNADDGGFYQRGIEKLYGEEGVRFDNERVIAFAVEHGFARPGSDDDINETYSVLTERWLDVIRCRRWPRRKRPEWLAKRAYV